jgi:toxin ParE1/3/4
VARLIWTEPALSDLDEIAEYIALDNPDAAKKLVQKVFQKLERLEQHPQSGRKPPELKKTSYREVIVAPCRIFYRADKKDIYILYVMRGERQLRKYLLEERGKETKRKQDIL